MTADPDRRSVTLAVNGSPHVVDVSDATTLLAVLRHDLGLTGSRFGCGLEQCGACMVLVDGEAVPSCARAADTFEGREITTVEGLGTPGAPHPLQSAFLDEQAGQCGYCLSGMLISAKALLDRNAAPSRDDIVAALEPNLCRCGAHTRIIRAVQRAAAVLRGEVP